jgi:hypothetical protein
MSKCEKLLDKAKDSPQSLKFGELLTLAECYGWEFKRQNGSHQVWVNSALTTIQGRRKVFNPWKNGMAADYQVKDLLGSIEGLR